MGDRGGGRVDVRVDVLGPLRLTVAGVEARVGGRREQVVLALLAAASGRQVTDERLVDEIWGEDPPASALGSLQVAVSRLRKALGGADLLRREAAGYALQGVSVDAAELSEVSAAVPAGTPSLTLDLTERGLALWRGEPFSGLGGTPTLDHETTRLHDDRLRLIEARATALLDLGDAGAAARLLGEHAGDHPYREGLWSMLALALYRSHRQAESLETLRRLREALVDELGVDPSPAVRALESQILAQDPALDPRPAAGTPAARAQHRTTLVGRADAMGVLTDALDRLLTDGRAEVVLVTGEAGIGKSTLAAALSERAMEAGVVVSTGRCHEADLSPAYWPWLPVVRDLVERTGEAPSDVAALLGGSRDETGAESTNPEAAAAATLRTFAAVSRLVAAVRGPLVVVLEDLHWSDQTSMRLLSYVAEDLRDRPVLLVGTLRPVEQRRNPALARGLADLARLHARRLQVAPLDEAAVGELVATVIDDPSPELVAVLTDRGDGNPFFVLELARLLAQRGDTSAAAAAALEVPDGIADVLRMRLLLLPDRARTALEVASVVGREFDAALLAAATSTDPVGLDDLDETTRHGLVEEQRGTGGFRFVHALTRETLYDDLPTGRRARLHADVGTALAARLPHAPQLVAEVAHHFAQASAYLPHLAEAAVVHGRAAALDADARNAFDEALGLWTRTLEVESRVPEPDRVRRHGLLLSLATARQRMGDREGMMAALDEAMDLALAAGDHTRAAEAATSFRSSGVWHWRELGDDSPRAVAILEECLEHVTDPALTARILANLGQEHYAASRPAESLACGERAVAIARSCEDPQVLRDCLISIQMCLGWAPGRNSEQLTFAYESLEVADTPEYEIAARFQVGTALHRLGRAQEGDEVIAPALELSDRMRHTGADVPLSWWRWLRAAETEDPEAGRIARDALERHRRTSVVGIAEITGLVALSELADGDPVPADVVASATGHPNRSYRAGVAAALCSAGQVDDGVRVLGGYAPMGADYTSLYGGCKTVVVLAAAGHPDLAVAVAEITPHADEVSTYGSVISLGSTALWIAIGLSALGRHDEARARLEQALAANARAGSVRWEREARRRLEALTTVR